MQEIINRVYDWNDQVDKLRGKPAEFNFELEWDMLREEIKETQEAMDLHQTEKIADWLVDIIVVWIGSCKKMGIPADAKVVFHNIYAEVISNIVGTAYTEMLKLYGKEATEKAINEVIDCLYTRLGEWAHFREDGKFIKCPNFREPNLSFLYE